MTRLRNLGPKVKIADLNPVRPQVRTIDPHYNTGAHKAWARAVLARSGWRCEHTDASGVRCSRSWPEFKVYADHCVELRDNEALRLDPCNGRALCAVHHVRKTLAAKKQRWSNT